MKATEEKEKDTFDQKMEELANNLADLQDELKDKEDAMNSDRGVITLRDAVAEAEKQLDEANIALSNELIYSDATIERTVTKIGETKACLIDTWDGEKKTLKYGGIMIKFTTRGSLKINDKVLLMDDLLERNPLYDVVGKYIKGFNLTNLKKYMAVHELPDDVAEIEYKTTVKLDIEDNK